MIDRSIMMIIMMLSLHITVLGASESRLKRKRKICELADRFIPIRDSVDRSIRSSVSLDAETTSRASNYQKALQQAFPPQPKRVLCFKKEIQSVPSVLDCLTLVDTSTVVKKKRRRMFPKSPERILDAPELTCDSRLTLIAWSHGHLAVALYDTLYIWNSENGHIMELCQLPRGSITSVCWHPQTVSYIAIGNSQAELQIWNVSEHRKVRTIKARDEHAVSAVAWCFKSPDYLAFGDGHHVAIHDVRKQASLLKSLSYDSAVRELDWHRRDGALVSGYEDGHIKVWCPYRDRKIDLCQMSHAITALAVSPNKETVLACAAKKTFSIWKASFSGHSFFPTRCLNQLTLPDDIVSIVWSTNRFEIAVAFGTSIRVYRYGIDSYRLTHLTDISAHESPILSLALSADGQTLVSEAEDETLRFWRVFPAVKHKQKKESGRESLFQRLGSIR